MWRLKAVPSQCKILHQRSRNCWSAHLSVSLVLCSCCSRVSVRFVPVRFVSAFCVSAFFVSAFCQCVVSVVCLVLRSCLFASVRFVSVRITSVSNCVLVGVHCALLVLPRCVVTFWRSLAPEKRVVVGLTICSQVGAWP